MNLRKKVLAGGTKYAFMKHPLMEYLTVFHRKKSSSNNFSRRWRHVVQNNRIRLYNKAISEQLEVAETKQEELKQQLKRSHLIAENYRINLKRVKWDLKIAQDKINRLT
jgi:hypothetical protein